jgi:predicted nucleic acid-binding protein
VIVVTNTSPLLALEKIGQLALLPGLFSKVIRPESVTREIQEGIEMGHPPGLVEDTEWLKTVMDPPEMVLRKELGAGETAAIALAVRESADLILLDDLAARLVAAELQLNVMGTLGILLAGYSKGMLKSAHDCALDLERSGFRVSKQLLDTIKSKER